MGRELFHKADFPNKRARGVSPPRESTSTSIEGQSTPRYFLPRVIISQLRRLISVMELEIAKDEQTILKCRDAIGQRREKISGYQERINDVKKQMDYYK